MLATREEIERLLADLELDRVERTISTNNTDKFCETICAFANDLPNHGKPGYLLVGVHDNGALSGLRVTDELLKNLAGIRSDGNIQPLPAMNVDRIVFDGGELAVVEVIPSDLPPVRYKGRTWIRIGPRKGVANEQEERILCERRAATVRNFDAQPCSDCGLSDLSLELFKLTYLPQAISPEVIEQNNRTPEQQLASLRFYDLKRECATHAGVLLFAKDPRYWLPGAYLQFVRFSGTVMSDEVLEERQFSGDLLTLLRELDSFVGTQCVQRPVRESAMRETLMSDYPEAAIRELLMNAVMHRDYASNSPTRFNWFADHIEIQNPGGLYETRPEVFYSLRPNTYRNPILAEAMKALGYVNRFGRGIERAQAELRKNGNPEAEFQVDSPQVFGAIIRGKT